MRTLISFQVSHFIHTAVLFGFLLCWTSLGFSQPPAVNWIEGPQVVHLGENVAQIDMAPQYIFANAADTQRLMQSLGNPISQLEVGLIAPKTENVDWFMIFEYDRVGYVKDDEKEDIDAAAILKTIQEGTVQANKERIKKGFPPVKVIGWRIEPHYDEVTHNLVWAVLGEENGQQLINYNTRLLGRYGYTSAVLVADVDTFENMVYDVNHILSGFSYKKGKSYAEYVQGDKIAKYGLTALIAGGAAAAAAKSGLLKFILKGGKVVILAILGFLSAVFGALKALFRGKPKNKTAGPDPAHVVKSPKESEGALLDRIDTLVDQNRAEDAIILIQAETRGNINDMDLAATYYRLLKDSGRMNEMLNQGKVYLDLLVEEGQKARAREVYKECLSHDTKFAPKPHTLYKIAEWFSGSGETKLAMNACIYLTKTHPNHAVIPEACFLMAKIFNERLNNKLKARKVIQWLIKKFPDHERTTMAKKYLAVLQ